MQAVGAPRSHGRDRGTLASLMDFPAGDDDRTREGEQRPSAL
jgi:hypothetical protein